MSITKKLIFSLVTVAIFLFVIGLAEVILRKAFPDQNLPFVHEVTYDQIQWFQINRSFLKTYFSTDDAVIPEFKPSIFRKEKTENMIRIFCLGESSMFGVPYQMTANIPGILRRQLREAFPEKEIEVINLGASAINSNVIRHFAPQLLRFDPDLILIYTGHNEFYGPEGIGAAWLEKMFPRLIQVKYDIRSLAIVKVLGSMFSSTATPPSAANVNLMQQVSNKAKVDLNSGDAKFVFRNFEENLEEIVSVFTEEDIPIVVSDVTSNLTFAPFEYDASFDPQIATAEAQINARRFKEAVHTLDAAGGVSQTDARIHFVLGRAYEEMLQFDSARIHYAAARDNDPLKFRAPHQINTIISRVSSAGRLPFFSADSIFAANSRNGIPDSTLFWEHLHPTVRGYYLLAEGFFDTMLRNGLLPRPSSRHRPLPFRYDSLHICWFDLAFGDRTIRSLTSKWPFRNFLVTTPYYSGASVPLKAVVDQVMGFEKVWDQGCYETAQIFWREGRLQDAITTYRAVIDEYPYNFYAHYLLGSSLSQRGEYVEASRHFETAIRSNPAYPFPMADLGLLLVNQGEFDRAIAMLNRALLLAEQNRIVPLQSTICYGLATAYANKKQFREAASFAERSLQLVPANTDALQLKQRISRLR